MDNETRAAGAREDACRLLAACYYEPEPAFAEEGLFTSLLEAVSLVGANLVPHATMLKAEFDRTDPELLLIDYAALFLGPGPVPAKPYGSVWLENEKTIMGESTVALLDLYRQAGFEMEEDFHEVPDHVAVELECLYLLMFRENEAVIQGDTARAKATAELRKRLLAEHLGRWIEPFTSAMQQAARTPFYRSVATLTRLFVEQEMAQIGAGQR